MDKALLNSTNTAFGFWNGESSILPILENIFHYAIFPFPGLLLVGNNLGDALIGSIVTSSAIQAFALAYVGWNYNVIKEKIATAQSEPVAILPSAIEAKKYFRGEGSWWNLAKPALMRMPLMLTGPLSIGNSFGQATIAAGVGTMLIEWSVLDYVRERLVA